MSTSRRRIQVKNKTIERRKIKMTCKKIRISYQDYPKKQRYFRPTNVVLRFNELFCRKIFSDYFNEAMGGQ